MVISSDDDARQPQITPPEAAGEAAAGQAVLVAQVELVAQAEPMAQPEQRLRGSAWHQPVGEALAARDRVEAAAEQTPRH